MQLRPAVICGVSLLATTAASASATTWSWNWTAGMAGNVNNAAGQLNSITTEYDDATNQLSWYINVGSKGGYHTDAFTLALNGGNSPRGAAGQNAMLYFDASSSGSPILTVYGYNGQNSLSSYMDGGISTGIQTPDRIASSMLDTSWIMDVTARSERDGSRTLGFTIDASVINDHLPSYRSPETDWHGLCYEQQMGVWMNMLSDFDADYEHGWLSADEALTASRRGWFDSTHLSSGEPVPEPTTLALLGTGLVGLAARHRRRRK